MIVLIFQTFKNYKRDSIKLLIFKIFDRPFIALLVVYLIALIVHVLNELGNIFFYPKILGLLMFALGIGITGMILYSLIYTFKLIRDLNKEAKLNYEGEMQITINSSYILVQSNYNERSYKINWNQIKELLVIGKTAYLIPVRKNDFMIRINKNEIIKGNFEDIINFISYKWKNNSEE